MTTAQRYDRRTIILHWLSALLIVGLWCLGMTIDWFPRGEARTAARSTHILVGATLLLLIVWRLVWRIRGGVRIVDAQQRLRTTSTHVLYLLMFATLCLGIFCTWARGDSIFGLFRIPAFDPGNRELRHDAVEWHELAANTLLAVAALHALAALWHQFVRRDGLIDRMRFAPRPPRD